MSSQKWWVIEAVSMTGAGVARSTDPMALQSLTGAGSGYTTSPQLRENLSVSIQSAWGFIWIPKTAVINLLSSFILIGQMCDNLPQ